MNKNNLFPVAKEGWIYVGYSVLIFIIFSIMDLEFLEFFSFLTIIFFLFIYRNPERATPFFHENSIVSPVDGKVIAITELNDKDYAYKVEMDSSYFNVSLLRVPFDSILKSVSVQRGARLSRFDSLSKKINENAELVFEDKNANNIKISHILKQSFSPIKIEALQAQNFLQGNRYGVMVSGTTTIYLPQNIRLNVAVGNELTGSESLIGYFS